MNLFMNLFWINEKGILKECIKCPSDAWMFFASGWEGIGFFYVGY